ncbi:MAG: VWA containing CoxE family protein [Planctomycetota bacterium]
MFLDFFFALRQYGLKVTPEQWLDLLRALTMGLENCNLQTFYYLCRSIVLKSESEYDAFDVVFVHYFSEVEEPLAIREEIYQWLQKPIEFRLFEDELKRLGLQDLDELRKAFEDRLKEQKEAHQGGKKWIGTGGTSKFGAFGHSAGGIRVGGGSMNQAAVKVAAKRQFMNYRHDVPLDVRNIKVALKGLRKLAKEGREEEINLPESIRKTCENAGEIELAFQKPRKNAVKLLLLMDSGGSMLTHTRKVNELFSASHASNHFKRFEHYYFHNCVYDWLYTDIQQRKSIFTRELLEKIQDDTKVILVGDACMSSEELVFPGGCIDYWEHNNRPGIEWLRDIKRKCHYSVWLNPDPEKYWNHPTVKMISGVFPMFTLTLDGLNDAIHKLIVW